MLKALLVAGLCLAQGVAAQSPSLPIQQNAPVWLPPDQYGTGEGLPDATVNSITHLPNGQVWLGTMLGLARQDGARMTPVAGLPAMDGRAVLSLASTEKGELIAAIEGSGIFRLQHGLWQSLGNPFGVQRTRRIRVFKIDGTERIYATGTGVARWDGRRWQALPIPAALSGPEIFDIAVQAAAPNTPETLWLASLGGGLLRCVSGQACTRMPITGDGPRTDEVRTLLLQPIGSGQQALWVGMFGGGVARWQDEQWTRWHNGNSALPSDFVNDLALIRPTASSTEIWAGTRSGLAVISDGRQWQTPAVAAAQPPLSPAMALPAATRIRSILQTQTSQGAASVWLGSDSGALRIPLTGAWQVVSTLGNRANGIWSLLVEPLPDGLQRVWLASDGEGVARLEHGQWRYYGRAEGLPNLTVRSILRVQDGNPQRARANTGSVWVGTWGGHELKLRDDRFEEVPTPWQKLPDEAASLMQTDDGELWVSTRSQGIARWAGQHWDWMPTGQHAPSRIYSVVTLGRDLWFSTLENGLARLRDGQWRFFQADIGLPNDALYDMRLIPENGRNILWSGSNKHGLLRIDVSNPDRPQHIIEPALPLLPIPLVYGAVQDGTGSLVVCTDYGVFRWRRAGQTFLSTAFHRQDGLPHDECTGGAMQVDNLGRVWIGTVGGAAVFTPERDAVRKPSPLVISALLVDGKPASLDKRVISLPERSSRLEISFNLLTGEKEAGSRYRLLLLDAEGGQTQWGAPNLHVLARLPSGRQRVRIEAMDMAGMLATPVDLVVNVPYAWWQTPVARTFMVVATLLGFWAILQLRLRYVQKLKDKLTAKVIERTSQLQASENALRCANDELHRLSYTDPLTGLANRRRLFEALDTQFRNAMHQQRPLAVLMIDLDHFKQLNDSLGHLVGDQCLKTIAQCMLTELPPQALVARYGGEEFCVLLPGLDAIAGAAAAEILRQAVNSMATPCCGHHHPRLTISLGLAVLQPGQAALQTALPEDADALLAAADRALYAAKDAGRNCLRLAPDWQVIPTLGGG